jgi:hypothetical protein
MKEFLEEYGLFVALGIMFLFIGVAGGISNYTSSQGKAAEIQAISQALSNPNLSPEARKAMETKLININNIEKE